MLGGRIKMVKQLIQIRTLIVRILRLINKMFPFGTDGYIFQKKNHGRFFSNIWSLHITFSVTHHGGMAVKLTELTEMAKLTSLIKKR